MGTLVAVCVVYRRDIADMFRAVISLFTGRGGGEYGAYEVKPSKARLAFMLIIGTLPLILAIPLVGMVEAAGSHMWFVGLMLLVTGGILYYSDRLAKGRRTEKNMTIKDAATVGLLQATLGLLPGISRSGITITGGLMTGLDRRFAVRFSFLLSIPAILGANIIVLFRTLSRGLVDWSNMPMYLVGVVVAGVTGFFAIHLVKLLVDAGKFGKFAYWCWLMGAIAIIMSIARAIMA